MILVGKPEGKRPLERSSHRWENNIEMNVRKCRSQWPRGYRHEHSSVGIATGYGLDD
jgi:hypothetical protein